MTGRHATANHTSPMIGRRRPRRSASSAAPMIVAQKITSHRTIAEVLNETPNLDVLCMSDWALRKMWPPIGFAAYGPVPEGRPLA